MARAPVAAGLDDAWLHAAGACQVLAVGGVERLVVVPRAADEPVLAALATRGRTLGQAQVAVRQVRQVTVRHR